MTVCGTGQLIPRDILLKALPAEAQGLQAEDVCCGGAAVFGPDRCDCWVGVYSPAPGDVDTTTEPTTMPRMCGDCAFRRNSPERRDDPTAMANSAGLAALVETETPFWCHDGLPKLLGWRHDPTGTYVPVPPGSSIDHYSPRIVAGVPYRANGAAGARCAGWAAAVERKHRHEETR